MSETESTSANPPTSTATRPVSASGYRAQLLAIKTPVTVVLAEKKESLRNILALVPGSMLTFDTHCDHPLELCVGGHVIANGETVKIGDKFGIRVRDVGIEKAD